MSLYGNSHDVSIYKGDARSCKNEIWRLKLSLRALCIKVLVKRIPYSRILLYIIYNLELKLCRPCDLSFLHDKIKRQHIVLLILSMYGWYYSFFTLVQRERSMGNTKNAQEARIAFTTTVMHTVELFAFVLQSTVQATVKNTIVLLP